MSYNDPLERLSQIDPNLPSDAETADKAPAMLRQIRSFLKNFLGKSMNDDGSLKPLGIVSTQIGAGEVRGADSNTATEPNELLFGTVSTPDLRDAAVATAKLADDAVTSAKLADDASVDANRAVTTNHIRDGAVAAAKLATDSVTTVKVVDKAVTDAKLANDAAIDANRAVGTNHIKDAAVTTAKIGDLQVTVGKLAAAADATILGGTGTGVDDLTVAGALTATRSGTNLIFALAGITNGGAGRLALLSVEKAQNSALVSGDFASAISGTRQHVKFTNEFDPGQLISLDANGTFTVAKIGFYAVFAQIDFDAGTFSRLLLGQVNVGGTAYDSFPAQSNGAVLLGFFNTTAENTRFGLVFKDAALSATQGTAKNSITGERYATLVILAL